MHLLKSKWFERFARKSGISDQDLWSAVSEIENGLVEADLGAGVIKKRIARKGGGKSGGYRTIVLYRAGSLAVFVYGYGKNERSNISDEELKTFRAAAKVVLKLTQEQLATAVQAGAYVQAEERRRER